jgi:ubiquitin-protein ligase E3 C
MDIELHANLVKLLQLSEDELNSLSLTFSIDEKITENKTISVDLIPNGSITPVTVSNRLKFIHEMSNYKLNKTMSLQSNYFLSGLYEMISKDWLTMFNPYELQLLISGENEVNVQDLKANTVYGGFNETDETIVYLWQIVDEMSRHDRSQFVKFATSVPKAPLLGFKVLNPKFGIANDGSNTNRLPTSSTCVNLLRLPNYRNKEVLREKLLYAINSEARFDLA